MFSIRKSIVILALILPALSQEGKTGEIIEKKDEHVPKSKAEIIKGLLLSEIDFQQRQKLNKALDSDVKIEDKFQFKVSILKSLCEKKIWEQAETQLSILFTEIKEANDLLAQKKHLFSVENYLSESERNTEKYLFLSEYKDDIEMARNEELEEYKDDTEMARNEELEKYLFSLCSEIPSAKREELNEGLKRLNAFNPIMNDEIISSLYESKLFKDAAHQFALFMHYIPPILGSDTTFKFMRVVKDLLQNEGTLIDIGIKVPKNSTEEANVTKQLMESGLNIIRKLKEITDSDLIYDSVLLIYHNILKGKMNGSHINFTEECWKENKNSAQTKILYAENILLPQIKDKIFLNQYIEIYTEVLSLPRFKCLENFTRIGLLMWKKEEYPRAIAYFTQALKQDTSDDWNLRFFLAGAYGLNGDYKKAIEEIRIALKTPNTNIQELEKVLLIFYQKAGMTKEASELMAKKMQESVEHRRKKGEVKKQQQQKEIKQPPKTTPKKIETEEEKKRSKKLKEELLKSKKYSKEPEVYNFESDNLKKEYTKVSDEKTKTRKAPDPEKNSKRSIEYVSKKETLTEDKKEEVLKLEDLLNSNSCQTVSDIFEVFLGGKKAASVKVSLDDIELVWKALGGDFDTSKGKGSHTKLTIDIEGEDQMLILSKKTFLIDYQLEQIAQMLLDMGLYPKDMEEILKEKKLL